MEKCKAMSNVQQGTFGCFRFLLTTMVMKTSTDPKPFVDYTKSKEACLVLDRHSRLDNLLSSLTSRIL